MNARLTRIEWCIAALAALFGFSVIWASTAVYGPGVSSDAVYYLSTAENFAKGRGFFDFSGNPLVLWPPLYSFLLGIIYRVTGLSLLTIGYLINALCTGSLIVSSVILFRRCFPQGRIWFILSLLAVTTVMLVYTMGANIGADLLFLQMVVLFLLTSQNFIERPSFASLLCLALIAAGAAMLRWVGLTLVLSGLVLIGWAYRKDLKRLITHGLLFAFIALLPFSLWAYGRNYLRFGTLFGSQDMAYVSVIKNLQFTAAKINYWFFPNQLTDRIPAWLIWLGILVLLLIISRPKDWLGWLKNWFSTPLLPLLVFSIIYFVTITLTVYTADHRIDDIYDDRYQSPLYFIVLVGIILGLEYLVLAPRKESRQRWVQMIILVVFAVWFIYPVYRLYKFTVLSQREGVVAYNLYNTRDLNQSKLVIFIKQYAFEDSLPIYTNNGEAIFLFTGRNSRPSPQDLENYRALPDYLEANYCNWPDESMAYMIWFKSDMQRSFYSPSQLAKITSWTTLFDRPYGSVLIVSPRSGKVGSPCSGK